jgi:hypothetical protein
VKILALIRCRAQKSSEADTVPWCPWPESNQHSLRNSILSRARLPIPPQGLFATLAGTGEVAKPAEYSGQWLPVNPGINLTRSAGAGRSNAFAGMAIVSRANATGAGINRFRVVDRIKQSRVIVLHLDSATRAG